MKMKKLAASLLALTMVGGVTLGVTTTSYADTGDTDTTTTTPAVNVSGSPAKAYLTKEIDTPVGTTIPAGTYNFSFTNSTAPTGVTAPAITDESIVFSANDSGTTSGKKNTDVKYVTKSTQIFEDVKWPAAGIYTYNVKENSDSSYTSVKDASNGISDDMEYSKAEYEAAAYVSTDSTGATYLKYVTVTQTKDENGTDVTNTNGSAKVSPTEPTGDADGSGKFTFVNKYVKSITTDPTNPGQTTDPATDPTDDTDANSKTLAIMKKVEGDLVNKTDTFTFKVKITLPSLVKDETITAEVVGQETDGSKDGDTYAFEKGSEKTLDVELKHGQVLVFKNIYVGTKVEVEETNLGNYNLKSIVGTPDKNYEVALNEKKASGNVTENQDSIVYTNEYDSGTPTGLLINNLPFIVLIGAAAAGFALYIAGRRRRA